MSRKRWISVAVGLALSAALLWSALRSMDLAAFGGAFAAADRAYIPLLALGCLLTLWLRVERWRLLLPGRPPRAVLFRLIIIGLAVNNVLPARLGELARALFAARDLKLPLVAVLASILIERLLDALTILSLYLAAAAMMPESPWVGETLPVFAPLFGSLLAGFIAAFLLEWFLESSPALGRRLKGHPKVLELVEQLVLGLKPLRSPAMLAPILLWGLALWGTDAGNYFFGAKAVPLEATVSYPYSFVVLATAGMSTLLPAAPGYIGLFEYAVMKSVTPLGISPESAFAYGAFLHMVAYALVTALGIFFLYREGSSLTDVWRTTHRKDHA